jgi:hypothetical protein
VVARGLAVLLAAVGTAVAVGCGGDGDGGKGAQRAPDVASRSYSIRGIYDRDFSASGFDDQAAIGFNVIDSDPNRTELDTLAARHLKGLVWLGGYSNSTCAFNNSDAWVRAHVRAVAGHGAIAAYYIDDEPDAAKCPSAPMQMRARSRLVKSIDPQPPTLLVSYKLEQLPLFAGTVDIVGLDHYPCSIKDGCDFTRIDKAAAAADRAGIRYWGVIQAYGDNYYKLPTPEELRRQFAHWRTTKMEGYLVFAWHWPPRDRSLWLANHPELQRQLSVENGS